MKADHEESVLKVYHLLYEQQLKVKNEIDASVQEDSIESLQHSHREYKKILEKFEEILKECGKYQYQELVGQIADTKGKLSEIVVKLLSLQVQSQLPNYERYLQKVPTMSDVRELNRLKTQASLRINECENVLRLNQNIDLGEGYHCLRKLKAALDERIAQVTVEKLKQEKNAIEQEISYFSLHNPEHLNEIIAFCDHWEAVTVGLKSYGVNIDESSIKTFKQIKDQAETNQFEIDKLMQMDSIVFRKIQEEMDPNGECQWKSLPIQTFIELSNPLYLSTYISLVESGRELLMDQFKGYLRDQFKEKTSCFPCCGGKTYQMKEHEPIQQHQLNQWFQLAIQKGIAPDIAAYFIPQEEGESKENV